MARPRKDAAQTATQGETKDAPLTEVQKSAMAKAIPAPAQIVPTATQTFQPAPTPVPVTMEPGKIQLQQIIAKEKSEWPTPQEVEEALRTHVARGMSIVQLTNEYWHLRIGTREASGNLKMPLKQIVMQANVLMAPTRPPTEE